MEVTTLTAMNQVRVPKAVREALCLRKGDQLSWELNDGSVRVRALALLDLGDLRGLVGTLVKWNTAGDEQTFRDLLSALERYAVVRVPFPFTDRQVQRRRSALVLFEPGFLQASCHLLLGVLGSLATTDRAGGAAPLHAGS
jgi:bifunctional DNA-binding transcriptional regulator/antitoxin component of YhaV-PrlF toxin-antitoxin module